MQYIGRNFLPIMPSPAFVIVADVCDMKAIFVRMSVFKRFESNPTDFVTAFSSDSHKFFWFSERVLDALLRNRIILFNVNVDEVGVVFS